MKKKALIRILIAIVLCGCTYLSMLLFEKYREILFPAYRTFSKAWIGLLSWLSGHTAIAMWDIGLVIVIALILITLVYTLVKHKSFLNWLSHIVLIAAVILVEVVGGWMLNHYAPPLADELGLDVREYSKEELYEACEYYLLEAAQYAPLIERDEEGHAVRQNFAEMAETAGSSYRHLGEMYPVLKGSKQRVKKLSVVGEYLMYNGIIGMFMPITGEAGVPASVPTAPLGYTMCHEAAHRLGIASEEEANFAAYLACMDSSDVRFLYSGNYQAFGYCFSSLYGIDPELALSMFEEYDEDYGVWLVRVDRYDTSQIYLSYESVLQDVSDRINDTYLKTFSEEDGIRSYGMVTDDLIAYYQSLE